jgi:plastocyanin
MGANGTLDRLMWRHAWVLLLLVPAAAHAHPGHGPAIVQLMDFPDNRFQPASVTVGAGDTVIWQWNGSIRNHSVTADDGSFDSDPGEAPGQIQHPPNDQFTYRFEREGTFPYYCKVHPSMAGQVTVVAVGGSDVTRPQLSGVRVSKRRGRPRVHFSLSEPGDVLARIRRRKRTVKSFDIPARQGQNRGRIPTAGLEAGRYSIVLTAFDRADNRSRDVTRRFRLGRR